MHLTRSAFHLIHAHTICLLSAISKLDLQPSPWIDLLFRNILSSGCWSRLCSNWVWSLLPLGESTDCSHSTWVFAKKPAMLRPSARTCFIPLCSGCFELNFMYAIPKPIEVLSSKAHVQIFIHMSVQPCKHLQIHIPTIIRRLKINKGVNSINQTFKTQSVTSTTCGHLPIISLIIH